MIQSLYIRNYLLIDHLELDFSSGFITMTGETGAGKSILMGALSLILGQRVDTAVLKLKDAKCIVPIFTNEAKNLFPVRSLTWRWAVDVTRKSIRQKDSVSKYLKCLNMR